MNDILFRKDHTSIVCYHYPRKDWKKRVKQGVELSLAGVCIIVGVYLLWFLP